MKKIILSLFYTLISLYSANINLSHANLTSPINQCYLSEESNNKMPTLIGTWKNQALGIILHFYYHQNQFLLARYQFTPISLVLEQEPFFPTENDFQSIQIFKDTLTVNDVLYHRTHKPLTVTPNSPGTPLENYDIFCETFKQFYAFFAPRNIDWPAISNHFRSQISSHTTDDELFEIFKQMLHTLKDNHAALAKGFSEGSEQYFQFHLPPSFEKQLIADKSKLPQYEILNLSDYVDIVSKEALSVISEKYIIDKQQDPSEKIIWGKLQQNPNIGYLNILSMEYNPIELELVLDKIINCFNENKITALIFDVRFNQGGNEEISAAFAKRFADQKHLILTTQEYHNGKLTPKKPLYISPGKTRLHNPSLPKILLTSPITASAAEGFVLALSTFPNLTRIGESTMGILSDQFARKLPNGWWVTLSNQVTLSPEGKSYEISGIPPHIQADFPLMQFSSSKRDPGIESAIAVLLSLL